MKPAEVSIILPAFNAENFICASIESILDQSFKSFELIIVDDGSIDSTLQKIRSFKDHRILIIENKHNIGISKSINKAIDISCGKYIARIDSDDLMIKNRIELQYKFLEEFPEIGVVGSAIELFGNTIINRIHTYPSQNSTIKSLIIFENPLAHPSVMFRRDLILRIGGYSEDYPYIEDWELWYRLSKITNFHNLSDVLIKYRIHNKSVSQAHTVLQEVSKLKLIKLMFDDYNLPFNSKFFKGNFRFSYKNLESYYFWLLKLKEHNQKEKRLNVFAFNEILNNIFLNFLYRADKDLIKIIAFYLNNQLFGSSRKYKILGALVIVYRYIINKKLAFLRT